MNRVLAKVQPLHQILVGILVVQIILAVVVFLPRTAASAAGAPLLGPVKAEDITSLTIRDERGASIVLAKQGDQWMLPDADSFPADSSKLTSIATKLAGVKNSRLVGRTAASHAQLQVSDTGFLRQVVIGSRTGQNQTLFFGSSSGGSTHVRLAGQDEVYLAGGLTVWELSTDSASWIDATYLSVPEADVVSMTLSNANGQFAVTKDANGVWSMAGLAAGETFDMSVVATMVGQLASLQMNRPLSRTEQSGYGLAQPSAVVTLQTSKDNQAKTYTLTVGAKDAQDSTYVAKSSESSYYVRVAEWAVKDLVEKKREGFLKLPATPVPTPKS